MSNEQVRSMVFRRSPLTRLQIFAELYYSTRIIQEVVGVRTTCMRPPYGDMVRSIHSLSVPPLQQFSNAQDDRVRYIAQQLGLRVHRWNADTDDWRAASLGEAAVVAKYGAAPYRCLLRRRG